VFHLEMCLNSERCGMKREFDLYRCKLLKTCLWIFQLKVANSHLLLLSHLIYLRPWSMVSHQIDVLSALDVVFCEENSLNTKPCTMTPPNSNLMAVISL
jgi:hypothetical protein